jgi:hypothetical protein
MPILGASYLAYMIRIHEKIDKSYFLAVKYPVTVESRIATQARK